MGPAATERGFPPGGRTAEIAGIPVTTDYGDPAAEYAAARDSVGLHHLALRGIIEVTGRDRAGWLNNLVTNAVKELQPGKGVYTFAVNQKGRILFDFNVLCLSDALWLDIDRRWVSSAIGHFERYIFSEQVALRDRTAEFARIGVIGPRAAEVLIFLAAAELVALTDNTAAELARAGLNWECLSVAGSPRMLVRTDFAGLPGFELWTSSGDAGACWKRIMEAGASYGIRPVGRTAVESLRIEAGLPASVQDLNEDVLPAETGLFDRAVSTTKGCYLGHEIIERMRSRGAAARRLVGFRLSEPVNPPAQLVSEEADIGMITSTCHSFGLNTPIGLGYLKLSEAEPGRTLHVTGAKVEATVAPLPFSLRPV